MKILKDNTEKLSVGIIFRFFLIYLFIKLTAFIQQGQIQHTTKYTNKIKRGNKNLHGFYLKK